MNQQEACLALGANIRRVRLEKQMTQQQLADAVGVTAARISQIENGVKDCTVGLAADLAAALEEPLDLLFRLEKVSKKLQTIP